VLLPVVVGSECFFRLLVIVLVTVFMYYNYLILYHFCSVDYIYNSNSKVMEVKNMIRN